MHQCQTDSTTADPQVDSITAPEIGMKKPFLLIAENTDSGIFHLNAPTILIF